MGEVEERIRARLTELLGEQDERRLCDTRQVSDELWGQEDGLSARERLVKAFVTMQELSRGTIAKIMAHPTDIPRLREKLAPLISPLYTSPYFGLVTIPFKADEDIEVGYAVVYRRGAGPLVLRIDDEEPKEGHDDE